MTKHPRCRGRHRCPTTHNSSTLEATTWEFCTWGQPGIHNKSGCALSEWSLRALGHHKTLLATVSFGKTKSLRMVWCTHQGQLLWGFCFLSCLRLTSPSSRGHMLPTDFFSNVYTSQIWIFIWRAGTKILFSLGQPPTSVSLLELHLVWFQAHAGVGQRSALWSASLST